MTRLAAGLEPSRRGLVGRLRSLFVGGAGDDAAWESAEETLIAADVGPALAARVVADARRRSQPPTEAIREELLALLLPRGGTWRPSPAVAGQPHPILVVGVNGTGKTTTIAKLAARFREEGSTVLLAAADTFRAAAIDQLRAWADRLSVPLVAHAPGADPGAVVYDALDAASARGIDLVIADTAGRLHTKRDLMAELAKIRRVIDRRLPGSTRRASSTRASGSAGSSSPRWTPRPVPASSSRSRTNCACRSSSLGSVRPCAISSPSSRSASWLRSSNPRSGPGPRTAAGPTGRGR